MIVIKDCLSVMYQPQCIIYTEWTCKVTVCNNEGVFSVALSRKEKPVYVNHF